MTRSDPLESSCSGEPLPDLGESIHLVQRYQQGDRDALNALLERYQDRIRRIVRIKLGSRVREHVESMDIVQEANVVVVQNLDDFEARTSSSLIQWLSQIILNKVREAVRDRDKRPVDCIDRELGASSARVGAREPSESGPLPEELAWRDELRDILDESVTKLEEDHREVILLRDYCASDWDDVARQMGRTKGAAQELHRRAWIKLRRTARPRLTGLL